MFFIQVVNTIFFVNLNYWLVKPTIVIKIDTIIMKIYFTNISAKHTNRPQTVLLCVFATIF